MTTAKSEIADNAAAARSSMLNRVIEWEKVQKELHFYQRDTVTLKFAKTLAEKAVSDIKACMEMFKRMQGVVLSADAIIIEAVELESAGRLGASVTAAPSNAAKIIAYTLTPIYLEPGREDSTLPVKCALSGETVRVPAQSHGETIVTPAIAALLGSGSLSMAQA